MGGGSAQLALRATMLMMSAALELDFLLMKQSALGSLAWSATRPVAKRASSMDCTRGQLDGFCGGVQASARRSPPGASGSKISGGMGTEPTGPMPLAARAGETGPVSSGTGGV